MTEIVAIRRPPGPRFAGQPHSRSGSLSPGRRAAGPSFPPAQHRRTRGAGTSRRRQNQVSRQGRAQGGRERQHEDRRRSSATTAPTSWGSTGNDRARRHANKKNLGANAILGVSIANAHAAAHRSGCRSTDISAASTPRRCRCPAERYQRRRSFRAPSISRST